MKERYDTKCCSCGHEFSASKSIMQEWGILDAGHGSCPECGEFLNLTYDPDKEIMVTLKWDDHVKSKEMLQ